MTLCPDIVPEVDSQLEGKKTIFVRLPKGTSESHRTQPGTGSLAPSFTPEELAALASTIVHETQRCVDLEN